MQGVDRRAHDGRRGVAAARGRLPGHRAPRPRGAALGRHPGALRLRLPPPQADADVGETVAGESHAWVEWFCGNEWRGYDPTNLIEIGDRHVLVGRGRDYNDVPPLRGIYSGAATSSMSVTVSVTRLA